MPTPVPGRMSFSCPLPSSSTVTTKVSPSRAASTRIVTGTADGASAYLIAFSISGWR